MVIRSFADLAAKTTPGARPSREAPGRMPPAQGRMPSVKGGRRRRALWLPWASIALASVATAFIPARSQAAQAALDCPVTVQTGAQFVTEVTVDVGTAPLGSYGITLTYDGAVLTVVSVAGGNTSEFSGTPTNNKNVCSGINCETRLSTFQNVSTAGPTGVVSVAKVTFGAVASSDAMALIGLTVRSLFDTGGNPITPATGTGCTVLVTTPPTTTTTTTPPSTTTTSTSTSTTTTTTPSTTTTTSTSSTTSTSGQPSTTTTPPSTTTTTTRPPTTTTSTSTTTTRPTTTTTSSSSTTSTSTQPSTTTAPPSTTTTTTTTPTTTTTTSTTTTPPTT